MIEQLAEAALAVLPGASVDYEQDTILIRWGGEEGIVLLLSAEVIEFRLPTVEWRGSHEPIPSSHLWKRFVLHEFAAEDMGKWIGRAKRARKRQFGRCKYCGERFPLEHRLGLVCHGCAEEHDGVVF